MKTTSQFWLTACGMPENTFLYVNELTFEKDANVKKTAGHVLWPEAKIWVWYPRETTMDISRQALKDVLGVCLKTNTASFSFRQKHQGVRRH